MCHRFFEKASLIHSPSFFLNLDWSSEGRHISENLLTAAIREETLLVNTERSAIKMLFLFCETLPKNKK